MKEKELYARVVGERLESRYVIKNKREKCLKKEEFFFLSFFKTLLWSLGLFTFRHHPKLDTSDLEEKEPVKVIKNWPKPK